MKRLRQQCLVLALGAMGALFAQTPTANDLKISAYLLKVEDPNALHDPFHVVPDGHAADRIVIDWKGVYLNRVSLGTNTVFLHIENDRPSRLTFKQETGILGTSNKTTYHVETLKDQEGCYYRAVLIEVTQSIPSPYAKENGPISSDFDRLVRVELSDVVKHCGYSIVRYVPEDTSSATLVLWPQQ